MLNCRLARAHIAKAFVVISRDHKDSFLVKIGHHLVSTFLRPDQADKCVQVSLVSNYTLRLIEDLECISIREFRWLDKAYLVVNFRFFISVDGALSDQLDVLPLRERPMVECHQQLDTGVLLVTVWVEDRSVDLVPNKLHLSFLGFEQ